MHLDNSNFMNKTVLPAALNCNTLNAICLKILHPSWPVTIYLSNVLHNYMGVFFVDQLSRKGNLYVEQNLLFLYWFSLLLLN